MSAYRENQIAYEGAHHWVLELAPGRFEVYRTGVTHSTRCAQVSNTANPEAARARAIAECKRRDEAPCF